MNKGDIHLHLRIPRQVALCTISLLVGGALFSIGTALADGLTSTQTVLGSDLIMPYDGYLMVDSSPLTGARTIKFDLYQDATGGTVVWTETQTVNLYNGRFSVGLGSGTSLTSTILGRTRQHRRDRALWQASHRARAVCCLGWQRR